MSLLIKLCFYGSQNAACWLLIRSAFASRDHLIWQYCLSHYCYRQFSFDRRHTKTFCMKCLWFYFATKINISVTFSFSFSFFFREHRLAKTGSSRACTIDQDTSPFYKRDVFRHQRLCHVLSSQTFEFFTLYNVPASVSSVSISSVKKK